MGKYQMDNKIIMESIIGVGVLATSLVIGAEIPTYTTMLERELYRNNENPHEITLEEYPDFIGTTPLFSFYYDHIKIGMDANEDDIPEMEVVEVPIVKSMIFQFKKPVKLEFS
jgi:hypothetical protein